MVTTSPKKSAGGPSPRCTRFMKLDGEPPSAAAVRREERHLEVCDDCRAYFLAEVVVMLDQDFRDARDRRSR